MSRSKRLYERSKRLMPGGVNSPVRSFYHVGRNPVFIDHAKGSKIYDVDGREYIDYVCSYGPAILGHANERVVRAVQTACEGGLSFGAPTEREAILAELIMTCVPSMERLRLVNSGTEAVMSAVRAARGFTGREKIIKFEGCYHGHSDGMLVKAGSGVLTQSMADSAGITAAEVKNTLVAKYNDRESVEKLFQENPGEIAAVIVEPVAANMGVVLPEDGFLAFLRKITRDGGALLIFDEVITGFRLALGGAQEFYGVTPDLTTLGKIAGGGLPLAAYGGRREIMEQIAPLGKVYQAGTLSGNPAAVAAGIETLSILMEEKEKGFYERLEENGAYLAGELKNRLGELVQVNQVGSLLSVFFAHAPVTDYALAAASDTGRFAKYFNGMLERGIFLAPSQFEAMFLSAEHTKEELHLTACAAGEVLKEMRMNGDVN